MMRNIILILFLLLTACGFHLRGAAFLPPGLNSIYVDGPAYDPLTLALQQSIRSTDATLVKTAKDAQLTIQIANQAFNQQLTNISANTLVNTYHLQYAVVVQLLNRSGTVIYGPFTVQATSDYAVSDTQILGDNSVLVGQQQMMRQEAIGLIFNRLSAMEARTAIEKNLKGISIN